MSKPGDGNEQDLRIRPGGHSLDADNPMTGLPCETHGTQTDLVITNPDGGTTLPYDWEDTTNVCPMGFSIRQLDVLIMRILKSHFSNAANIVNPNLKQYVYTNGADSKLSIDMNTTWQREPAGDLPGLVVKRGLQSSHRVVMGDRGESGDVTEGITSYAKLIQGTHRITCIGIVDGQLEDLAAEVFYLFTCIAPALRNGSIPLHDFQCNQLGEIGKLDESNRLLSVAVDLTYIYEYGWTLQYVAPKLEDAKIVPTPELG